jgi:hypothetical protein
MFVEAVPDIRDLQKTDRLKHELFDSGPDPVEGTNYSSTLVTDSPFSSGTPPYSYEMLWKSTVCTHLIGPPRTQQGQHGYLPFQYRSVEHGWNNVLSGTHYLYFHYYVVPFYPSQ